MKPLLQMALTAALSTVSAVALAQAPSPAANPPGSVVPGAPNSSSMAPNTVGNPAPAAPAQATPTTDNSAAPSTPADTSAAGPSDKQDEGASAQTGTDAGQPAATTGDEETAKPKHHHHRHHKPVAKSESSSDEVQMTDALNKIGAAGYANPHDLQNNGGTISATATKDGKDVHVTVTPDGQVQQSS